ncbi:hypothetical protein SDC9_145823 [bioreactor metagenome]|uniref:Uncharacterized protein n=1 Tax=bioreactor metagenome TaxID=1076179 RepID=A0A645EAY6_9ZZZZ
MLLDRYDPASHQVFSQKHGKSLRKRWACPDIFSHMEALSCLNNQVVPALVKNVKVDAYLLARRLIDLPDLRINNGFGTR